MPLGAHAVTTSIDADIEPGIIFCLRAEGSMTGRVPAVAGSSDYPLAPIYLAHVGEDGTTLLAYPQAKRILDRLKAPVAWPRASGRGRQCTIREDHTPGEDMRNAQNLLVSAIASVVGKNEVRAVASLFSPGGTHVMRGEFAGSGTSRSWLSWWYCPIKTIRER
jgi:hypothetical protein